MYEQKFTFHLSEGKEQREKRRVLFLEDSSLSTAMTRAHVAQGFCSLLHHDFVTSKIGYHSQQQVAQVIEIYCIIYISRI